MSSTTPNPLDLNQAAAHDNALYDASIHDNQIVAMYETDAEAQSAKQTLVAAGFPESSAHVVHRGPEIGGTAGVEDEGLWGSIKSLFVPDEDRTSYNHAIARGHAMLVVTPDHSMDRQHLVHVLESTDPLDFDAKLEEWRQTGYDTTGTGTDVYGAAAGMPGSSMSNVATAGHATDSGMNTGYTATPPATSTTLGATAAASAPALPAGQDGETIKVLEERLRVGKREVAAGAVRIRSYIVERPVEEQVSLHEERIDIERRPVDRAATQADFGAFQERSIEARATAEEAIVAKDVRVVEEIGLCKTASDRTETIRDTVRKTEVEIEGDATASHGTLPGQTGGNPNATPDAATSGANSPRK